MSAFNSVNDPAPGLAVKILADDSPGATVHQDHATGEPSLRGRLGVVFADRSTHRQSDTVPERISVPHDYVDKHDWIEVVNPSAVVRPAGPADKPFAKTHTFPHADELVFHMAGGRVRYRVVHQPDKYDDETGEVAERAGDPTTHVDWFYVAELVEG